MDISQTLYHRQGCSRGRGRVTNPVLTAALASLSEILMMLVSIREDSAGVGNSASAADVVAGGVTTASSSVMVVVVVVVK